MEEKDLQHTPAPGLPEALHPEIGNGAAFAVKKHDFTMRSVDPTKTLEDLLPKVEFTIPELVEEKAKKAEKEVTSKSDKEVKSESTPSGDQPDVAPSTSSTPPEEPKAPSVMSKEEASPVKSSKIAKGEKNQQEKSVQSKETPEITKPPSVKPPAKGSDTQKEAEETKAPKPGKRIRKAAKAVQKQQEIKKQRTKKTTAKKASVKKAPAKKAPAKSSPVKQEPIKEIPVEKTPVKKAPAKKIAAETTPAKKVTPKKVPKREKFILSPFTQWLKELGGADYVHPYDDDFALAQEKGELNEVISETYANLLAAQGYKERAIEMYLKLIEKYPEKSSFFAAKIEALQ